MKLLIDIPEEVYDTIQDDQMISREQLAVLQKHIINGTPLQDGEFLLTLMQSVMTPEQIREVLQTMNNQDLTKNNQGEWVKVKENRMSIDMSGEIVTSYKCSKCGRLILTIPSNLVDYPFCHCGAEMKGGAE